MHGNLCKISIDSGGDVYPLLIDSKYTNGLGLCNPSILNYNGELIVNVRNVNYTLHHNEGNQKFQTPWGPLCYIRPDNDEHLRTTNFLCLLDNNFLIKKSHKVEMQNLHTPNWEFIGLEDARIVKWDNKLFLCGGRMDIKDDGEGRLKQASTGDYVMGNIIYDHGIITFFNSKSDGTVLNLASKFNTPYNNVTCSFSSSYKIFETQYKATINEDEFNYTTNPTIITGSQIPTVFSGSNIDWENTASVGTPLGFATSSYFTPYITTVGLYDDNFNLLAVGKLATPLQSSPTTDTTILVNIDR